jgi:hypothetical protein
MPKKIVPRCRRRIFTIMVCWPKHLTVASSWPMTNHGDYFLNRNILIRVHTPLK